MSRAMQASATDIFRDTDRVIQTAAFLHIRLLYGIDPAERAEWMRTLTRHINPAAALTRLDTAIKTKQKSEDKSAISLGP